MRDVPEYDEMVECANPACIHAGKTEALTGLYGMTGGGIGPYTVCVNCGEILTKSQDAELCESHEAVELKDVEDNKTDGTTGVDEQSGGTLPSPRK